MSKVSLTVILLTLNEEFHIADAIDNVSDIAENIFILDSFSSDNTVKIAKEKGCVILQRSFTNFGDQWNFALDNSPFNTKWTIKLDPDERLTEVLKDEIRNVVNSEESMTAYEFRRRLWFMGKPMHVYGRVLRLWRTGTCKFSEVLVNEHPVVEGKVGFLKGVMEHFDSKDLHHWMNKQNNYSTLEAETMFDKRSLAAKPKLLGNSLERRMFIKSILFKIPIKYTLLMLYNLFINGAYKDGLLGWRWSLMRSYVYRMRELKFLEMKTNKQIPDYRSKKTLNR
jgi:glycosyltransferase involved in cell wall biosynthesis